MSVCISCVFSCGFVGVPYLPQYAVALAVNNSLDEAVSELGWTDDSTVALNEMLVPSPRVSAAVTLWYVGKETLVMENCGGIWWFCICSFDGGL